MCETEGKNIADGEKNISCVEPCEFFMKKKQHVFKLVFKNKKCHVLSRVKKILFFLLFFHVWNRGDMCRVNTVLFEFRKQSAR